MKPLLALLFLAMLPIGGQAQSLENYRWKNRLVLVFTPSAGDPLFVQQYQLLQESVEELRERQVAMIFFNPDGDNENSGVFQQRSESEYFYDRFSVQPYQLELVLVGLDGGEKYRAKNAITPVSVLLELIDGMPMRKRELRQGYGNESSINQTETVIPGTKGGGNK